MLLILIGIALDVQIALGVTLFSLFFCSKLISAAARMRTTFQKAKLHTLFSNSKELHMCW